MMTENLASLLENGARAAVYSCPDAEVEPMDSSIPWELNRQGMNEL